MSTTDFAATSRHHLTSKEDLISVNHRSFDIDAMSRTLAEQGAEVLHLVDPQSFEHESLYIDACVGFQSSWLDLKQPEGRERALKLARRADVFVEDFRGRCMSKLGFSPQELAARRPGIIYASGRCYSYDGPWAHRGGFDMEAL